MRESKQIEQQLDRIERELAVVSHQLVVLTRLVEKLQPKPVRGLIVLGKPVPQ
jgi:hypothetical protein